MTDVTDNIDELTSLLRRKIELLDELKRALLVADLLGVPPKSIKTRLHISTREGPSAFRPWIGAVYSVRAGDEPWQDFKLMDVHHALWPEHILAAYRRAEARKVT